MLEKDVYNRLVKYVDGHLPEEQQEIVEDMILDDKTGETLEQFNTLLFLKKQIGGTTNVGDYLKQQSEELRLLAQNTSKE